MAGDVPRRPRLGDASSLRAAAGIDGEPSTHDIDRSGRRLRHRHLPARRRRGRAGRCRDAATSGSRGCCRSASRAPARPTIRRRLIDPTDRHGRRHDRRVGDLRRGALRGTRPGRLDAAPVGASRQPARLRAPPPCAVAGGPLAGWQTFPGDGLAAVVGADRGDVDPVRRRRRVHLVGSLVNGDRDRPPGTDQRVVAAALHRPVRRGRLDRPDDLVVAVVLDRLAGRPRPGDPGRRLHDTCSHPERIDRLRSAPAAGSRTRPSPWRSCIVVGRLDDRRAVPAAPPPRRAGPGPRLGPRPVLPPRRRRTVPNRSSANVTATRSGPRCWSAATCTAGREVWLPKESTVLVLAPPRSGKTSGTVAPAVVDHHGPVVATGVRRDIMLWTHPWRAATGAPMWLCEPMLPPGTPLPAGVEPVRWSPLSGCDSMLTAKLRAEALFAAVAEGGPNDQFWRNAGQTLLAAYLMAAAHRDGSIRDVLDWADRDSDRSPADALRWAADQIADPVERETVQLDRLADRSRRHPGPPLQGRGHRPGPPSVGTVPAAPHPPHVRRPHRRLVRPRRAAARRRGRSGCSAPNRINAKPPGSAPR